MKQKPDKNLVRPSIEVMDKAIKKQKTLDLSRKAVFDTVRAILVGVAAIILISYLWLPVFQISGSNMEPTMQNGDYIVTEKEKKFSPGDIVVFYYNNKLLVKRVIAMGGDTLSIDADGVVTVNGTKLDEPYVTDLSLGNCDLTFPYSVPANHLFVMGDNRDTSLDSRISMIGPIGMEQVVGKAIFRLLPLGVFGPIH